MNDDEAPTRDRSLLGGMIGRVAPAVIRQIDMDDLVDQLDVNAIACRLDLDAVMARIDIDLLVDRLDVNAIANLLDLDALMARIDMDALVARLDVNVIADKLDLDALMARIDVDAFVARLDVDAIANLLDLDALMARIDMDAVVDRLDVNVIADKLDLDALMARIDMAQITAGVTQDVATSGLDLARRQLLRADATVDGVVDRVLRRKPGSRPDAPQRLVDTSDDVVLAQTAALDPPTRRREVNGHYAGPATRLLALAADTAAALSSFGVIAGITLYMLSAFTPIDISASSDGWVSRAVAVSWVVLWFWLPVALFGRTPAMGLAGVAVVQRDGSVVRPARALVRALFVPVSVAILVVGLIGLVVGRERRALYDVVSGTVEIYDWGSRDAEQPVSIRQQLSARVMRRKAQR